MKPVQGALHHACDAAVRRHISFAHRQFHEPLEPRRLLSASFASLSAHGILSVIGTAKNNSILIQLAGTKVQAIVDGKTLSFAKSSVKRIWADGFGGNDKLTNLTSLPSTLIGSGGNDTMVGGSADDSLEGDAGSDTVDYSSRSGSWVFTSLTFDPVTFDAKGPIATLGAETDEINPDVEHYVGSKGNDEFDVAFISGHDEGYTYDGRDGDDTFFLGHDERATVYGGSGNDTFEQDDHLDMDVVYGQGGNDVVRPSEESSGPSFFDGGPGRDTLDMSDSKSLGGSIAKMPNVEDLIGVGGQFSGDPVKLIAVGNGLDNLIEASPNTTATIIMQGGGGNDTLVGGSENDSMDGGPGKDVLRPGDGNNFGNIDPSSDTLDYQGATPGEFGMEVFGIGPFDLDITHGSNAEWFDTFHFPSINASPNASPFHFLGTSGNDQIGGRLSLNAQIYGQGGNDSIGVAGDIVAFADDSAVESQVSLYGGAGNDTLVASGEDFLTAYGDGGAGNDTYDYEDAHSGVGPFVDTGGGLDSLSVSAPLEVGHSSYVAVIPDGIESLDIYAGEDASLIVYGNNLNNTIEAGTHNGGVSIYGEGGNDSLFASGPFFEEDDARILLSGGPGNDTLISEGEDDGFDPAVPVTYEGDSGNDTADFSARSEDLTITLDNKPNDGQGHHLDNVMSDVETILGGSGDDFIQGNPSFNKLVGNAGDDTLWGGGGNDTLDGGSGHDQLHGQAGNDLLLGKDGEKDTLDGGDDFDTATRDNGPGVFDVVNSIEKFTP